MDSGVPARCEPLRTRRGWFRAGLGLRLWNDDDDGDDDGGGGVECECAEGRRRECCEALTPEGPSEAVLPADAALLLEVVPCLLALFTAALVMPPWVWGVMALSLWLWLVRDMGPALALTLLVRAPALALTLALALLAARSNNAVSLVVLVP